MTWTVITDNANTWSIHADESTSWGSESDKSTVWALDNIEYGYVRAEYVVPDYVEGYKQEWYRQADKDNAWQS